MFIPPMPPRDDRPDGERGFVSLRDHLAMAALTGFSMSLSPGVVYRLDLVAKQAYELADAMLAEREAK